MNWLQLPFVSIWLFVVLIYFAEALAISTSTIATQSDNKTENISSNIHHVRLSGKEGAKINTRNENSTVHYKQQKPSPSKRMEKSNAKIPHHEANKVLLNQLGLSEIRTHSSHNRKRLAVESRRHALPDDSHMFVIKLPPNLYYYTSPKAVGNSMNSLQPDNGKKVSFNFQSNGKPGRVYHWNIPAMKKIIANKSRQSMLRSSDAIKKQTSTWIKPWENDTIDKTYGKNSLITKKSLKRKSPSYYAPTNSISKNSFHKYFPGNGKPKGFYIIKGNHKKPSNYQNIIS